MELALKAAAVFSTRSSSAEITAADAVAAARSAAAEIIDRSKTGSNVLPAGTLEAARVAAAAAAAKIGLGSSSSAASASNTADAVDAESAKRSAAAAFAETLKQQQQAKKSTTPADAESAKRSAAAAFAESLQQQQQAKKSRWGGSTDLATVDMTAGKAAQAMVVSQLSDKLAAFRKDRGVDAPASSEKLTLKLYVPEKDPNARFERNWVATFIGREGINKKRYEQQAPGARIFVRGEGTQLRGGKPKEDTRRMARGGGGKGGGGKGGGGKGGGGKGGRNDDDDEEAESMHVFIEADSQEAMDLMRVAVLAEFNPKHEGQSSALTLFDEGQIATMAEEKTTSKEECAFCGKPGHHHSKCPKRKSAFTMSGVKCAACGNSGHTARDCKGDKSNIVRGDNSGFASSAFEDTDFAAFEDELRRRAGLS